MLANKALSAAPSAVPVYVEDVFSTYLWEGNATARNIVNGIDLAGKGGMVWTKYRNTTNSNRLYDTNRGATKQIFSDLTNAEQVAAQSLTAFNADGFSLGTGQPNENTATVVGWTFAQQAKFFDVVTYAGNGTAGRTISHNLGSVPGCIIVKATDLNQNWTVYHRSTGNTKALVLNTTAAADTDSSYWNNTTPTSTVFSVGGDGGSTNNNGTNYVAYLFAHDAGGFGDAGSDSIIKCGSYRGTGAYQEIDLGWEPQWVMVKRSSGGTSPWNILDIMRGFIIGDSNSCTVLEANTSNAEQAEATRVSLGKNAAKGFAVNGTDTNANASGSTYIYIAIRRGPMKTPTSGTSVFDPEATSGATGTAITTSFPVDFQLYKTRGSVDYWFGVDRLRGVNTTTTANSRPWLDTTATTAEASATNVSRNWGNTGFEVPGIVGGASNVFYSFQRAPGFFDVVCYTGTGSATTFSHNLGVAPELIIVKRRNSSGSNWITYSAATGATKYLSLNSTDIAQTSTSMWNDTSPTSSVFTVGTSAATNQSSSTYVAYLFATVTGVSKVGTYSGTGSTQTINCGFTAGSRFVLIKRTDVGGDWYVWDSARGIVSGDDPYLLLNSTATEVTNTDYIDTANSGFEISSTAPAAINANGGSFIFLAIA